MKHFKMLAASLSLCMLAQSLWLVPLSIAAEAAETPDTTEEIVTVDASSSELFLPESYEQYLPLENPTDVALFGDHIAVADENKLYVFDGSTYRMYTHIRENAGGEYDSSISKISFDEDGTLYFADRDLSLYTLPYEALSEEVLQPQETDIKNCSTFCIAGDNLFIATVSNTETTINAYPLNRLTPGFELLVNSEKLLPLTPYMAYAGGKLYCATDTRVTAYTYTDGKYVALYNSVLDSTSSVNGLSALTALGDSFYYTVKGVSGANGLYRTDLQGHSVLLTAGENYVALTANGDDLYCIQGNSIKKLDVSGGAATETGYEITSASASFNRLNGATEVVRAKNLVVIADRINCRISAYNTLTEKYTLIPCTDGEVKYLPEYIATDGDIIGVSSENNVFVYTKNSAGEYVLTTKCTPPNIVSGLACVYGKCYFVTKGFGYGLASDDFDPSDICTRDRTETSAPCALIADVYGQLFVVHSDGSVFFYTEETFLDEGTIIGERADFTLPTGSGGFTSPRADFDGNIYCLSGSGIYKNGALFAVIKGDENVFSASRTTPVSFALGFEDNTVYLNYGDFIVKTNALTFPTLDTILTENAAERIFTSQESVTLVSVHEGSIGIRTDLDLLKAGESDYFPYSHYFRTAQAQRGILLTTTEKYSVVALFGKDHKYTANLFLTEGYLTEVPREEYWVDGSGSAYLSSDVSLSLFPCLVPALRGERLSRMDKISLVGIVSAGETSDYEYALVRCQSGAAEIEGFVPLSYLTHAAPISSAQSYRLAYLKENTEGTLFFSDLGQPITLFERTQIEISDLEEGTYVAHYSKDGVDYYATVTDDVLEAPQSNALRISLIVILTVVGVVIIGDYFFLRPLRRKKKNL